MAFEGKSLISFVNISRTVKYSTLLLIMISQMLYIGPVFLQSLTRESYTFILYTSVERCPFLGACQK